MKGIGNCVVGDTLYFYTLCVGDIKDTKLRGTVVGIGRQLIQCACAEINVDSCYIPIIEKDFPFAVYLVDSIPYIVTAEYMENIFHFRSREFFFENTRLIKNGK